ncbi:MAG: hypothetical protein IGS49_16310 [Chlorogloeopsis fritschii C42_A2020_084]|uniref:hypothetical protein n=1 Tax=Chlorogloeopsis fritschii TaxID=1124 RepID=UPI0019FDC152|nr:hypothetical protein [Chlorogloeopsis fritschii]MBF2006984.1 hypothetical protein [Chlorogloeopsis fritschii C42_A2020_084]
MTKKCQLWEAIAVHLSGLSRYQVQPGNEGIYFLAGYRMQTLSAFHSCRNAIALINKGAVKGYLSFHLSQT